MQSWLLWILKRAAVLLAIIAVTLIAMRIYDTQRGPPLELWHTYVPAQWARTRSKQADWDQYLAAEQAVFDDVRAEVTAEAGPDGARAVQPVLRRQPDLSGHFAQDWNRSYVLEPDGAPAGAVVLLHGLTDAPYSLRHIARRYRELGFVAVGDPAAGARHRSGRPLTDVVWEDWMAATRLAVREARRRVGPTRPLHIVGFSTAARWP